jgi:hypothetical protein
MTVERARSPNSSAAAEILRRLGATASPTTAVVRPRSGLDAAASTTSGSLARDTCLWPAAEARSCRPPPELPNLKGSAVVVGQALGVHQIGGRGIVETFGIVSAIAVAGQTIALTAPESTRSTKPLR